MHLWPRPCLQHTPSPRLPSQPSLETHARVIQHKYNCNQSIFLVWNPSLSHGCGDIIAASVYCIGATNYPSSGLPPPPPSTPTTSSPFCSPRLLLILLPLPRRSLRSDSSNHSSVAESCVTITGFKPGPWSTLDGRDTAGVANSVARVA